MLDSGSPSDPQHYLPREIPKYLIAQMRELSSSQWTQLWQDSGVKDSQGHPSFIVSFLAREVNYFACCSFRKKNGNKRLPAPCLEEVQAAVTLRGP